MRIHRTNYTQKPVGGAVDWSRHDATGLVLFLPLFGGPVGSSPRVPTAALGLSLDFAYGTRFSANGSGFTQWHATPGGVGLGVSQSGVVSAFSEIPSFATSPLHWYINPPFSVGVLFYPRTVAGTFSDFLCGPFYDFDGEGGPAGWRLYDTGPTTHVYRVEVYNSWTGTPTGGDSTIQAVAGQMQWLWFTINSTRLKMYGNSGVLGLDIAASAITTNDHNKELYFDTSPNLRDFVQFRYYNRVVPQAEIQQIQAEPWRIIRQSGARRYFLPSSITHQYGRPFRDVVGA